MASNVKIEPIAPAPKEKMMKRARIGMEWGGEVWAGRGDFDGRDLDADLRDFFFI